MTLKNEKEMGFFTFFSHAPVTEGMEPKTVLKPLFAFGPIRVLSSRLVPTDFICFLLFLRGGKSRGKRGLYNCRHAISIVRSYESTYDFGSPS